MWETTSYRIWIRLNEKDSDKIHWVSVDHIHSMSDYEIWVSGKRFKVKQTADEIWAMILINGGNNIKSKIKSK